MDGSHFDAWTRRRFGLATGGIIGSTLGLFAFDDARAGNKRKKRRRRRRKRCKKLFDTCTPGGRRKCCGDLRCDRSVFNIGTHVQCCKPEGKPCSGALFECCDDLGCGPEDTCVPLPSDRALKTNFGSVDGRDMLQRVRDLPISTWNYTSDEPSVRHIGPMAQDFAAVFGVGADDRHIHPIDGPGIALAAIQGLAAELERLRQDNATLAARIRALEDR